MIRTYNPPLNLQGNFNKTNLDFRKELSALRSCTSAKQAPIPNNQLKLNAYPQQMQCSNCGINLTIDEGLKMRSTLNAFLVVVLFKSHLHTNKERRQWIAVLIFLVVVIIFNISSREYSTSSRVTIESKTTGATKDHLKQKLWQE